MLNQHAQNYLFVFLETYKLAPSRGMVSPAYR